MMVAPATIASPMPSTSIHNKSEECELTLLTLLLLLLDDDVTTKELSIIIL